ncbi:MAG: hypothetical protein IKH38_03455 [Clostridia bacterium]|nr:hypothetical protein [Clostridia bacterium]
MTPDRTRSLIGLRVSIPDGFTCTYSDSRYSVWKYTAKDRQAGSLILDAEIVDENTNRYNTVEDVLAVCDWMTDMEVYVNPHGVRMLRGFTQYSGSPERRYYIEHNGNVMLMCMIEDPRYVRPDDCEALLQQTADGMTPLR